MQIFYFILLLLLFFLLGKSADILIDAIKVLGSRLRIKTIYIGFLLGFITTSPEIFIGINAFFEDIPSVSFGNLVGGVIVLLGLMMGLNVILRRGIKIGEEFDNLLLILLAVFFILPIIFIINGKVSNIEGLILMIVYVAVATVFFKRSNKTITTSPRKTKINLKNTFLYIFLGFLGIIMLSKLIIDTTLIILQDINLANFMIGIIIFSLGTNLPELIVVFEAWKKKYTEIGVGNLIGSAMANIFILGVFSLIKTTYIDITGDFYIFVGSFIVIVSLFLIFTKTGKKINPLEGLILIGAYIGFLLIEFLFKPL